LGFGKVGFKIPSSQQRLHYGELDIKL